MDDCFLKVNGIREANNKLNKAKLNSQSRGQINQSTGRLMIHWIVVERIDVGVTIFGHPYANLSVKHVASTMAAGPVSLLAPSIQNMSVTGQFRNLLDLPFFHPFPTFF